MMLEVFARSPGLYLYFSVMAFWIADVSSVLPSPTAP